MVEQLRHVEENLYQPLKGAPAKGQKGQKQLNDIQRIGKQLGFQGQVLEQVPAVLKKALDKRKTHDGIVIDDFELEVSKHYVALESDLKEEQSRFDVFSGAT